MSRSRDDGFGLLCRLADALLAGERDVEIRIPALPADTDWRRLIGVSGTNLVTPLLGRALERTGLLEELEDDLRIYFRAMMDAARHRNATLRRRLLEIAAAGETAGIPLLLLKGAIRLFDGLYEDDCWRFMHDLDLLVPATRLAEADRLLRDLGWRPLEDVSCEEDLHLPPLVDADGEVVLELHRRALLPHLDHLLPAEVLFARARSRGTGHGFLLVPDPEDQLVHLVAHGHLMHGHLYTGRLLLRDAIELACLAAEHGTATLEAALRRLEAAGCRLAGEVALETARATLPNAAGWLPAGRPFARLLARRAIAQQRSPLLMTTLAPLGAVLREWRARSPTGGFLRRLRDPAYHRHLSRQWRAFRRKTSW